MKKGASSDRFIVNGYIKSKGWESITETYKKWNMTQLEVYYGTVFVMDVYYEKNLKSLRYN